MHKISKFFFQILDAVLLAIRLLSPFKHQTTANPLYFREVVDMLPPTEREVEITLLRNRHGLHLQAHVTLSLVTPIFGRKVSLEEVASETENLRAILRSSPRGIRVRIKDPLRIYLATT